jgi:hypothetical protein
MILPENGSVVIIDDKPNEALPILKAFSKRGISVTYYQGYNQDELPDAPVQNIRLAIVDLQLLPSDNDGHTIATRLINILKRIISPDNGPYMLLVWSLKDALFGDSVKQEINRTENNIVPAFIVTLNKTSCLVKQSLSEKQSIIDDIIDELPSNFEDSDVEEIKSILELKLIHQEEVVYEAKPDSLNIIQNTLAEELKNAGVFHLFVIWENLIKKAGETNVQAISNSIQTTELWEQNMRDVIKRMARAKTGQNVTLTEQTLKTSLSTFTNSFTEELESKIRKYNFPDYINLDSPFIIANKVNNHIYQIKEFTESNEIKVCLNKDGSDLPNSCKKNKIQNLPASIGEPTKTVAKDLVDNYIKIPHIINSKLLFEFETSNELLPGNVYYIDINNDTKKDYLLTYFDSLPSELNEFKFLELEVSPICDYAQNKWKKSRLLSGVLYPENLSIKKNSHFYPIEPALLINEKLNRIVFDFQLFKSLDKEIVKKRTTAFRLKRELLLDIIANLSGHVNRPGITFVS